ncbi:septal ring lytic transglycosylase RlpA family protein [Algoriphagus lutimaris]|uniref:septal ring lytic transglycosylase RlpA family protein n=1 Tax=Algoriphagus lutimaris TaxID=613197 RepID=UPI00196B9027|nr:septal ring lytic transglycosylase RlpA family protein [Algoriphagus lutimaris]MBN3521753.1 septal ring lytic transglycosylase RlpA family protein [Algoriphagus lutimaris]
MKFDYLRKWMFLVFGLLAVSLSEASTQGDSLLIQEGVASFYGKRFHLRKTSNGEIFHMDSLTAAHKTLPFGTVLKVTRVDTGTSVWVKVNDRLPKYSKRIIDLSRAAARELDMIHDGITLVKLEVVEPKVIEALIDYYGEEKPPSIRLRRIAFAINYTKPSPDWLKLPELTFINSPL